MAFPQGFMDELHARSDIVDVVSSYVALTRKGGSFFGLCPFHIHNKLDSVTALFAAEAVIHLPPRFHVKGRRFLAVKGA